MVPRAPRDPELELVGATLPGLPAVVLGHNGAIAWGFTNTGADTQDLFIERVDPEDPTRYLTPGGAAPFAVREEIIEVAGGAPVALSVRTTRHGPVISDLLPDAAATFGADRVVALAWSAPGEDDLAIQALLGVDRARDWSEFVAALRDVGAPMQNIFYADASGHIGFIAPGRVPIRKRGDGRWPVPGWTGEYDWTGWVPFDALPRAFDPAERRAVQREQPHRAAGLSVPADRRLGSAVPGPSGSPSCSSTAVRTGGVRHDAGGRAVAARAGSAADHAHGGAEGPAAAAAMARLEAWDRVMRADAAEPLIFAAWYRELSRLIYADELGDLFDAFWHVRPQFMELILTGRQIWCDDVRTDPVETCAELAAAALDAALLDLDRRFGDDPDGWRWGDAHVARMTHPLFAGQPLLGRLFDIEAASGGDSVTVDVGHFIRATSDGRSPAPMRPPIAPSTISRILTRRGSSRHRPVGQSAVTPLSRSYEIMGVRRVGADRT